MKRFYTIAALALTVGMFFCGCAKDEGTDNSTTEASASVVSTVSDENTVENSGSTVVSLSAVFDSISSQVTLPEMIKIDSAEKVERYYGITSDQMSDFIGGVDSSGVGQDEIIIIKASDESNVAAIKQQLQVRYDSKLAQNENYNADEAEKIRNCKVDENGLYVYMIISDDAEQITKIVEDAIA